MAPPTPADLGFNTDCEDDSWATADVCDGADDVRELSRLTGGSETKFVLHFNRAWCDLLSAITRGYPQLAEIVLHCNYISIDRDTRVINLNALPKTLRGLEVRFLQNDIDCRHLTEFLHLERCCCGHSLIHTEALPEVKAKWIVLIDTTTDNLEEAVLDLPAWRAIRKSLRRGPRIREFTVYQGSRQLEPAGGAVDE